MSEKKSKDTRVRNWTCVLYPDSAPSNWREIIDSWMIEWIESPLHDKDFNATGEQKKSHYHLLFLFGGVKSYEQVLDLVNEINATIPQRCHNAKSLVRYMAHLDNPDKAQYNIADVVSHGGVDVASLLKPTSSERYSYIREMQTWCIQTNCIEFQDLMDFAMLEHFDDWYPLLCDSCAFIMQTYLRSRRHRQTVAMEYNGCIVDSDGVIHDRACQDSSNARPEGLDLDKADCNIDEPQ